MFNRKFLFIVISFELLMIMQISSCSGNNNIPMKTLTGINIPDGEFIRFSFQERGEKTKDEYYVLKKEKYGSNQTYFRIFATIIMPNNTNVLPYYTNWPVTVLFDPVKCQTVDSVLNFNTNILKEYSSFGVGGLVYSHYWLDRKKSEVDYVSKSINDKTVSTKNYRIKVNTSFPIFDPWSSLLVFRVINSKKGGIMYWVIPDFMKDPMPVTMKFIKNERITTSLGTFNVDDIALSMGDPFMAKLMGSLIQNSFMCVEDSERRLILKSIASFEVGTVDILSNVNH